MPADRVHASDSKEPRQNAEERVEGGTAGFSSLHRPFAFVFSRSLLPTPFKLVAPPNKNRHDVNAKAACSFILAPVGIFQENCIPCSHAHAFILFLRERLDNYFPAILTTKTWQSSYAENVQPVDISGCRDGLVQAATDRGEKKARREAGQYRQDNRPSEVTL